MLELRLSGIRAPVLGLWTSFALHLAAIPTLLLGIRLIEFPLIQTDLPFDAPESYNSAADVPIVYLHHFQKLSLLPAARPHKAAAKPEPRRESLDSASGLIFIGPQTIISLPVEADNRIQTVRRLDLIEPPKLNVPFRSPNIWQMASPTPSFQAQPQTLSTNNNGHEGQLKQRYLASPTNPVALPASLSVVPDNSGFIATDSGGSQKQGSAEPQPNQAISGQRSLVVLNAIPSQELIDPVPEGEMSGAFEVSPAAGNTRELTQGPAVSNRGYEQKPGMAGRDRLALGNTAVAENSRTSSSASAFEKLPGAASGDENSESKVIESSPDHERPGASSEIDISVASAPPISGTSPAPASSTTATRPVRTPAAEYALTIVASSAVGGGLKDYGVFRHETVYTVFIPMAEPGRPRPNWILQYATIIPPGEERPANSILVPPFPDKKDYPVISVIVPAEDLGTKIVLAGTITAEGRIEQLQMIHVPGSVPPEPFLDCLAKWTFQPAQWNGKPVAVKFLMGVPLARDMFGEPLTQHEF